MNLSLEDISAQLVAMYRDPIVRQGQRQTLGHVWERLNMRHSTCSCHHTARMHLFVWGCYHRDEEGRVCKCRRQPWVSVQMKGTLG